MPTINSKSSWKVLVFGAGAIGTYIGGSLALQKHNVVFLARPKTMSELREHGLRLDLTIDQRRATKEVFVVAPRSFVAVSSLQEALNYGPFDVVIFALKSFGTPPALEEIKPFADKLPPVLCLSNGVDNEPMLASVLGTDKVIYGTVTSAIGQRSHGDIVLEKLRGTGIASGHPLSEKLVAVFNDAYLKCRLYANADEMKWSKMFTNLIANPTSAILNMTAAQIFADKRLYELEIDMLKECLAVMKAKGLKIVDPPGTPARALAFATKLPLWISKPLVSRAVSSGRGGKMPSFHIDLYSGRDKSEVEFLHGAVVREGKKLNVPTPVNQFLVDTLLSLIRKDLPLETYANQPEKLLAKLKSQ